MYRKRIGEKRMPVLFADLTEVVEGYLLTVTATKGFDDRVLISGALDGHLVHKRLGLTAKTQEDLDAHASDMMQTLKRSTVEPPIIEADLSIPEDGTIVDLTKRRKERVQ